MKDFENFESNIVIVMFLLLIFVAYISYEEPKTPTLEQKASHIEKENKAEESCNGDDETLGMPLMSGNFGGGAFGGI